jgi:cytochrome c biogenesis protein CcdA
LGAILLVMMAVRVAENPLAGDWRLRFGRLVVVWPGSIAGLPQKYLRWGLIGAVVAALAVRYGFVPMELRVWDAAILAVAVLAGAGVDRRGAAVLGLAVAALNTVRVSQDEILYGPVAMVVQAVLMFAIVYVVSRTDLFYQEKRFEVSSRFKEKGYLTSGIMGAVFAAGWTPCMGPNLGLALTVAGSANTVGAGTVLLSSYALGLGIPFLVMGFAFGSATRMMRRIMTHMHWLKWINATLLLAMAALILTDALARLATSSNFLEKYGLFW